MQESNRPGTYIYVKHKEPGGPCANPKNISGTEVATVTVRSDRPSDSLPISSLPVSLSRSRFTVCPDLQYVKGAYRMPLNRLDY
jgi:hypothetical protein